MSLILAKYYHGDERQLAFARVYSFSDRIRYYWPDAEIILLLTH